MPVTIHTIRIQTSRRTELNDATRDIEAAVRASAVREGVCHLYVPHTTADVIVNEGYDPDVARDMEAAFDHLVPDSPLFRHSEGNSDSHIKTALLGSSVTIFIAEGRLRLGRWQKIFFAEFDGPRSRELHVKITPDPAS
jgi:secondary thiamine-phosphate synthase enzyme